MTVILARRTNMQARWVRDAGIAGGPTGKRPAPEVWTPREPQYED